MMTPLGVPGASRVTPILKNEGDDDVMTKEVGAGRRKISQYKEAHYLPLSV